MALNQGSLGVQAFHHAARDGVEYWFKPHAQGEWALMVLNWNQDARKVRFDWKAEDLHDDLAKRSAEFGKTRYKLRNLWNRQFAGSSIRQPSRFGIRCTTSRLASFSSCRCSG